MGSLLYSISHSSCCISSSLFLARTGRPLGPPSPCTAAFHAAAAADAWAALAAEAGLHSTAAPARASARPRPAAVEPPANPAPLAEGIAGDVHPDGAWAPGVEGSSGVGRVEGAAEPEAGAYTACPHPCRRCSQAVRSEAVRPTQAISTSIKCRRLYGCAEMDIACIGERGLGCFLSYRCSNAVSAHSSGFREIINSGPPQLTPRAE